MEIIYKRPESLTSKPFHYCPGCTHVIYHRLVAEVIDELGIRDRTIGIAPVGCAVFAYEYFNVDMFEASHGRAPAVATGIKRVYPDSVVFTYQGDGDLAAIGTAEIIHSASRGEKITVIFINNAIYGMTGGQMAPTTIPGQKTTTSPYGRNVNTAGYHIKVVELLSNLQGAVYLARASAHNPKNVIKAKQYIKKAFTVQLENKGFSLVELLSICPVNWKMEPLDAFRWVEEKMIPEYPLGVYKDTTATSADKEV